MEDVVSTTKLAVNMPKDSLTHKKKAPVTITQAPTEQDEETSSGLVLKRKWKATAPPPPLNTLIQMPEPRIKTSLTQLAMLHTKT